MLCHLYISVVFHILPCHACCFMKEKNTNKNRFAHLCNFKVKKINFPHTFLISAISTNLFNHLR